MDLVQKSKILVTGGAGYIGSHTVQALLSAGHDVIVYDNLSTGFAESVPQNAKLIVGDVLDTEKLTQTLLKEQINSIIHFAAKLIVEESVKSPMEYYETNIGGAISLCKAVANAKIRNLVFSSTAAVYAPPDLPHHTIDELNPTIPINPYGKSKLHAERIFQDFTKTHDLNLIILRYFNVAGASVDNNNGLRSKEGTHLLKLGCKAALGLINEIKIFGVDYPTPDGTCLRDYIHVQDLADIHVTAIEFLMQSDCVEILNCGYGKGFSVFEVLNELKKISRNNFPTKITERRHGDPASLIANPEKLRKILNWRPKHNNLSLICRTALSWESKYWNREDPKQTLHETTK